MSVVAIDDRGDSVVFFEVPNVMFTLKDLGIWDLIYEHCGYFSISSLAHLFETCGFKVLKITESFGGQFLCSESVPSKGKLDADHALFQRNFPDQMEGYVKAFADKYNNMVKKWQHDIKRMRQDHERVVIWGVGSKGVTFLNTLRKRKPY